MFRVYRSIQFCNHAVVNVFLRALKHHISTQCTQCTCRLLKIISRFSFFFFCSINCRLPSCHAHYYAHGSRTVSAIREFYTCAVHLWMLLCGVRAERECLLCIYNQWRRSVTKWQRLSEEDKTNLKDKSVCERERESFYFQFFSSNKEVDTVDTSPAFVQWIDVRT